MGHHNILRVLATRPKAQNSTWCQRLNHLGFQAIPVPVIDIEPVTAAEDQQSIKSIMLDFDQFDHVIFVSQNAVQETFHWLDQYWPQWPVGMNYWGIGSKTTASIAAWGVEPHSANTTMNSEALLEQAQLQTVEGKKILICRGKGGRTHLGDQLIQRGAHVTYCELYHRQLAKDAAQQLRALEWQSAAPSLVASVFSGETLERLTELMVNIQVPQWQTIPVLVPGERVATLANHLGYSQVLCALNASEEKMGEALLSYKRQNS